MKSWLKWVVGLCIVGGIYQGCESCVRRCSHRDSTTQEKRVRDRDHNHKVSDSSMNYKKACESKDFETAYDIVDKMKKETSQAKVKMEVDSKEDMIWDSNVRAYTKSKAEYEESKKKSIEAERYVILQEAMTVLENEGDNGLMRIVAIAKEHNAELWLYDELKDIARKIGNSNLENQFEQLSSDMEIIIQNMDKISLDDKYIINKLVKLNQKDVSEKVLGCLSSYENQIPSRPALGIIQSTSRGDLDASYELYNKMVKNYNNQCLSLMNIAINNKNSYLAKRTMSRLKPSLNWIVLGDWEKVVVKSRNSSLYNAIKVTLDNEDINNAKTTYLEAVKSGAFE